MQSIDSLGLFWLPDHDGDRLSGRLKFDPAGGGINLSLVGTFDNAADDGGEPAVRIFGWLGSNPVTLERTQEDLPLAAPGRFVPGFLVSRLPGTVY